MSTISPRIQGYNSALNVLDVPILPDSGINMRSKHLTLFFPRHDTGDKIESELKSDEGDKIGRDRRRRLGHTLHPTYTLHPTPYTLHPTYTLHPIHTPHPAPSSKPTQLKSTLREGSQKRDKLALELEGA